MRERGAGLCPRVARRGSAPAAGRLARRGGEGPPPDHAGTEPRAPTIFVEIAMKVAFLAPDYPAEMPHFVRGLAECGAEVIGVARASARELSPDVARYLSGYVQIEAALLDERAAHDELVEPLAQLGVDRVEALWEPLVLLAARLRESLGLPGMTRDVVLGFRDKQLMKERVAAAGLRVPRSRRAASGAEVRDAAEDVGFPLVLKPIAGAGTADTHLVPNEETLERLIEQLAHVESLSVEEYVVGDEYTHDCVSIDGVPAFESVARYFPKPLESRNKEWISPAQVVYRDPFSMPELRAGIELGRGVLQALGMGTGFTHMEWFRTPEGEAVFGEIGARPPGAKLVDQMNWANDFDVYRGWAQAVTQGQMSEEPARRYHVACVFKRAQGAGRIARIEGADAVRNALGPHIVEDALLPIGHPRRDWRATLLSDGWIAVRHPRLETCRAMMQTLVNDIQLHAR